VKNVKLVSFKAKPSSNKYSNDRKWAKFTNVNITKCSGKIILKIAHM
jgi:hypothetical protein